MLSFVLRNLKCFGNIFTLKLLYFSLVRSKLKHLTTVWNALYKNHSASVEYIKTKFLRCFWFTTDSICPQF